MPGHVAPIAWSGDDDIRDAILPRFVAAAGHCAASTRSSMRSKGSKEANAAVQSSDRHFDPDRGGRRLPELCLVIVDPVMMALPPAVTATRTPRPGAACSDSSNLPIVAVAELDLGLAGGGPDLRIPRFRTAAARLAPRVPNMVVSRFAPAS
jgi:hypothetical protein